jgi:hypothetical protein
VEERKKPVIQTRRECKDCCTYSNTQHRPERRPFSYPT